MRLNNKVKLSIIIPVFNEEKTIGEILSRVSKIKLPFKIKKEIIVVNDASTDNTKKIVNIWQKKGIEYTEHLKNQGKGAAIKSGLEKATGDLVVIQDADLEYDPTDYIKLMTPIISGNAQVVYGTRLINYPLKLLGKNKTVMPIHLVANHFLTTLTNILYGGHLTDMETCYKVFKRQVLDNISIKSNRFDFEPEITAKILKLNIPIIEVPIKVKPRTYREGKKIGWIDGLIAIWTLFKYKFTN